MKPFGSTAILAQVFIFQGRAARVGRVKIALKCVLSEFWGVISRYFALIGKSHLEPFYALDCGQVMGKDTPAAAKTRATPYVSR